MGNIPNAFDAKEIGLICICSFCKYFILHLSPMLQLLQDKLDWVETIIRHMTSASYFLNVLVPWERKWPWIGSKVRLGGIFRTVYLLLLPPTRLQSFTFWFTSILYCFCSHPSLSNFSMISGPLTSSGSTTQTSYYSIRMG